MNVTSLGFAGFTLLTLILYYALPRRAQNVLLLVASYAFLATWAVEFAAVFALLTVFNFWVARQLYDDNPQRQAILRLGVIGNIAVLIYFKYVGFFVDELSEQLNGIGVSTESGILSIALPIGLSFYMVQAISYLLDVNRGLSEPIDDPIDFATYMAYFPRVTSGPIERARDFMPQLSQARVVDNDQLARSFNLILYGVFRKVVIADVLLVILPSGAFGNPSQYTPPQLTIWLLAYAFAIYNDFAGYTSLIRGVSGLFGIELSKNFNTPYFSRNFTEFWQRWHISLSNWLRDYIFTPFTRSLLRRKYKSRHPLTVIAPPMLTMIVSALWHEVALTMILWGILHGVFQVLERVRGIWRPYPPPDQIPRWRQAGAMAVVFSLAVLAWVPFRADNLGLAFSYWERLLSPGMWITDLPNFQVAEDFYTLVLILVSMSFVLDVLQHRLGEFYFLKLPPIIKAIVINVFVFFIILATAAQGDAPPPFIYQGF